VPDEDLPAVIPEGGQIRVVGGDGAEEFGHRLVEELVKLR
jgi:hypothetical protein